MSVLGDIIHRISYGKEDTAKEFELIGNCFGFYSLDGGVGTSTLCLELANLASEKHLHTCIVDCSPLSTFYLSKLSSKIKNADVPSINKRFVKRTCKLSDCFLVANDYLKVLSFGDTALIDTFELPYDIIKQTYIELKESFDLVIMDIPNLPWCESVVAALQQCSTVYTVCNPSIDAVLKRAKLKALFSCVNLDSKLNNMILGMSPRGENFKGVLEQAMGTKFLAEYPYVPSIKREAISNFSILANINGTEAKIYSKCIDFILHEILYGISGKNMGGDN